MSLRINALTAQRIVSHAFGGSRTVSRCAPTTLRSFPPENATAPASPLVKGFSTYSGSDYGNQGLKAYPQYGVHGMTYLVMKVMPPGFKVVKNNILNLDTTRKGRMLFEFTPRGADGRYAWTERVRFALSPEEMGLLVNQLPHYKVEFSRVQSVRGEGDDPYATVITQDTPEKVLTVEPGELGAINFTIDYVKDGVGGQLPGPGQDGGAGPLTCEIQAGEFEVMSALMRDSIPKLTGWSQMMDITMKNVVDEAVSRGGGGGDSYSGGGGGGGGDYSGGGGVPF